jgi:hypothetical protein
VAIYSCKHHVNLDSYRQIRATQVVLPGLRHRQRGRIIKLPSLAAQPGGGIILDDAGGMGFADLTLPVMREIHASEEKWAITVFRNIRTSVNHA